MSSSCPAVNDSVDDIIKERKRATRESSATSNEKTSRDNKSSSPAIVTVFTARHN
ncbi:2724_t:CDS:1, partial [Paraglomus brasilianum]